MIILAIDPGYERIGMAILKKDNGGKEVFLFSECFHTPASEEFPKRLVMIQKRVRALVSEYKPEALAIETLFFTKNHKTALGVAEARGVVVAACAENGLSIHEYSPLQIKNAVSGYGKATKEQVYSMTQRLINIPKKISSDDEMDAIAIGITCFASI